MNKKPLYQPWSEEEFQSDMYVRAMNPFQRWMYAGLIRSAFTFSTRPYLPNDDKVLWVLAGCPDYGFWEEHKKPVLDRFKIVVVNGKELLENKRVSEDWEKLEEYRFRQSEKGKLSGRKRRFNAGLTDVEQNVEVGSTGYEQYKDKIREECNVSKGKEEEMRRRTFEAICHRYGLAPDPKGYGSWGELAGICEGLGERAVESAFEEWASQHPNSAKPIAAFVKDGPKLARKLVVIEENPRLDDFCDWVSDKSDMHIIFNKLQRTEVSDLLDKYQYSELVLAFEKFYGIIENDLYQLKFGAKDFVEKAPQILRTIQKRKEEADRAAKELAEIKSRVAATASLEQAQAASETFSAEDGVRDLLGD